MTDETSKFAPPPKDGSGFRALIGLLALVAGILGFGALFFVAVPASNRDALMLALGTVMGWGASVVSSEFGASATGRKAADAAVRQMEGTKP